MPTTFVIIRERVTKLAGSIVQENIVRAQGKITVYEDIAALYPFTFFPDPCIVYTKNVCML